MSAPLRPRSPRWSVLLRVGVGLAVFGLFVMLFTFDGSVIGVALFGAGIACLLAALVTYFREAAAERERVRGARPPSRRTP